MINWSFHGQKETLLLIKADFVLTAIVFVDLGKIVKQLTKYWKGQRKGKNKEEARERD